MKRNKITVKEANAFLDEVRAEKGIIEIVEKEIVDNLTENAKRNSRYGDKILMCINPIYIHFPDWQRELNRQRAEKIGKEYNAYKWEIPKIIVKNGKVYVIDGMHRTFGALLAGMENIIVELLTGINEEEAINLFLEQGDDRKNISPVDKMHRTFGALLAGMENIIVELLTGINEEEAINLFLEQGDDRKNISPVDKYNAALTARKPEYIKLKEICEKNHVAVKGDQNPINNPIGILTSISDGVTLVKTVPETFDRMLSLLERLQWNAGNNASNGKVYSAKILRVFKKLYAYYIDRQDEMENVLLTVCKGSTYFNDNIIEKYQDTIFDFLSEVIERNIDVLIVGKKSKKPSAKANIKIKMA